MLDEFRCDYCRQLFIAAARGGCQCCGAPWPENKPKIQIMPSNAPVAILTVPGYLSEQAVELIRQQWNNFIDHDRTRLLILQEGMSIKYLGEPHA